jgi:hypothetical protein
MHRKTGIEVPDTGIRDENGLEPMDHLFSSPEKEREATARKAIGARNMNATISSEEDMDVDESRSLLDKIQTINIDSTIRHHPRTQRCPHRETTSKWPTASPACNVPY